MTAPQWQVVLRDGLRELGLGDAEGVAPLVKYVGELERWSERLGLVHAEGVELVIRHILDSLAPLPWIRTLIGDGGAPQIADIGSGGGLPGVPLACFLPYATVHLVERSGRKCGFLRGALLAAGIRNTPVVNADLATVTGVFDLVVFRAFQPLSSSLVGRLSDVLRPGGAICAYKGKADRTREEVDGLDLPAGLTVDVIPVRVPFLDEERHLVVVRE